MRVPLNIRRWRLLNAIVEPPTIATTADSVEGNLASGSFQGGSGGNVTVNILNPPPEPPPPPPETATLGDRIRYITLAMMNLQQMFTEDRNDRLRRQAETNVQYSEAQRNRQWIWRALAALAVVVVILAALVAALFWQFQTRFGFL